MKKKKLFSGPRTAAGRLAADMLRRYYTHDVARDSAALTYYLLFAIFPLLIFISTLLGLLDLDIAYITSVLEPLLPVDVVDVIQSYLEYVSANQSRQLLWFSLVFSIWFPMRATGCLMHSLRKAFGQPTPESMWRSQWRILLFTVWLIVVIAVTLVLVVIGRRALEFVGQFITMPAGFIEVWSYMRFIVLALVITVSLVLLYVLQSTPGFLSLWGVKPFLVIPAAVAIAMYEGEFVGALYGALGGMLCDLGANTFYGFYTITLFLYCTAVGLALIYLMKNDVKSAVLCCLGYVGAMALIEYLFYYLLYAYPGSWQVLLFSLLPRALFTCLLMPLFYLGERYLFQRFDELMGEL